MIKLTAELKSVIAQNKPVVALESTIIAHGMPFPQNLKMAQEVEHIIRDYGANPATIAVIDGELRAGLSTAELEHFAKTGPSIIKVSTRDLPFVVARNHWSNHSRLNHALGSYGRNSHLRHRRHRWRTPRS